MSARVGRTNWIDVGLGALAVGLSVATGLLSVHVSSAHRYYLYGLCVAFALVAVTQTARAIRATARHDRAISELRAGQKYLAQPESYRQFDALRRHHQALQEADDRFRESFQIDDLRVEATRVRCLACGWDFDGPLADGREEALAHLDEDHAPRRGNWRTRIRKSVR